MLMNTKEGDGANGRSLFGQMVVAGLVASPKMAEVRTEGERWFTDKSKDGRS